MKIDNIFLKRADEEGRARMTASLKEQYPNLNYRTVGRSILGRDIDAFFIGKGRRVALYIGTHHAMECISANLLYLVILTLLSEEKFNSVCFKTDCKSLLSAFTFCIVPCLNPDGVELRFHGAGNTPLKQRQMRMSGGDFTSWQANARGVDLNHNYSAGFWEYKKIESEMNISAGATLYSGEYPESEPETRTAASLMRALAPCVTASLHSQGEEVYTSARGRRLGMWFCQGCGYKLSTPEGTAAYGGMTDYSNMLNIPALTIEVGKGQNPLDEKHVPAIFERIAAPLILLPTAL